MKINTRLYKILIKVLVVIVVVVVVGVAGFLGLQISGKNRLYSNSSSVRPELDLSGFAETMESISTDEDGAGTNPDADEGTYVWQEGDVRYNGKIYRYNEEILTFLFMGVDKMTEVKPVKNGIDGGQSDAIFLLVMNPRTKELSVIGIPRDTMTEIDVYDKDGRLIGPTVSQLCLQHGYGDGAASSCERSVKAVSALFYQLPIHGYCSINMGAIPLINDAVGGIELTALEDVIGTKMKEGDTLHLKGENAYYYLHNRDTGSEGSAGRRLNRQKQYLSAYAAKAAEEMKSDITLPVRLYNTLSKYMVTDVTVDEVSYLATQITDYHFDSNRMYSLEGETVQGEVFEEFYPDEQALYELILDVFYEEVN